MKINIWITPKNDKFIKEVIQEVYTLSPKVVDSIYDDNIKIHIDKLKDNCYFGIFQMTIKVVDKYTKYFVKGDTTPVKINFFKENLQ